MALPDHSGFSEGLDFDDPHAERASSTADPVQFKNRNSGKHPLGCFTAFVLVVVFALLAMARNLLPAERLAMLLVFGPLLLILLLVYIYTIRENRRIVRHLSGGISIGGTGITLWRESQREHISWSEVAYVDVAVSRRIVRGGKRAPSRRIDATLLRLSVENRPELADSSSATLESFPTHPSDEYVPYSCTVTICTTRGVLTEDVDLRPASLIDEALSRFAGERRTTPALWYQYDHRNRLVSAAPVDPAVAPRPNDRDLEE